MRRRTPGHITGCLVGGAAGDALGAPVEFMDFSEILAHFGPDGISEYAPAYGRRGGAVTDDTQMALFTAEGLILSRVRAGDDLSQIPVFVWHACLRWLMTQNESAGNDLVKQHGTCAIIDGLLANRREMYAVRAPGNTCISALKSGCMGTMENPLNDSKGCGGIMRVAPVGLFLPPDQAFEYGCRTAAITHGHPTGYLASGTLAQIISEISYGADIIHAVDRSLDILKKQPGHKETLTAVNMAVNAWKNAPVSPETLASLGQGWIAEETLAIGLYCALAADGDFDRGIRLAVNHSGDSDSTGTVAGNLLGLLLGMEAIPRKYLDNLELLDIIQELAEDLFGQMPDTF